MPRVRGTEFAASVRAVARRDEWNGIVREFRDCDVRHAWEWGELRARQGWTPLRLAAFAGGECLAAFHALHDEWITRGGHRPGAPIARD